MKRSVLCLALAALLCLSLLGCGANKEYTLDAHEWTFSRVQTNSSGSTVYVRSDDMLDEYPKAAVLALTGTVGKNTFTIAHPDGRSWEIQAVKTESDLTGLIYELTYTPDEGEAVLGYAIVSYIQYEDHIEYLLLLNIGGYSICFEETP